MATVGKILIKHLVPKEYHEFIDSITLDKKGISTLCEKIAKEHPEDYNRVVSDITRLGFEVATQESSSVSLDDLRSPVDKEKRFSDLEKDISTIKKEGLSKSKENEKILQHYFDFTEKMDKDIVHEGVKQGRTLASFIAAGARGSAQQYRATVASPGLVMDAKENPMLHFPVKHSFAEGLSLPEYLATSYGARAGAISTKLSVSDSGYLSKKLVRSSMTIKVEEHDCGTDHGLPVSVKDKDSIGAFLAQPVGTYKKNNPVTGYMLGDLATKGINEIVVRSPTTCQSSRHFHSGAVCQMCVGQRENGLAPLHSYLGIVTAGILGEPLSQSTLSKKHTSGSASRTNIKQGFELINQLLEIPENFPGGATIAEHAGKVTDIKKLDAGGHYIIVGDHEHYVEPNFKIHVKKGDEVGPGQVLSEGIINPEKIVKFRGIGEGRKNYVDSLNKAFKDSGIGVNRRNFEIIAKNAIDHVEITDPEGLGDYLPQQVVSYQAIEKNYKPRSDSKLVRIDLAKGKYLEEPVLHYTIGTPVTQDIIKHLKEHHIESINVHDKSPGFIPRMTRLVDVPEHENDLFHVLYSTNILRRLTNAVNTGVGASSDIKGPSPIGGLAYGVGFHQNSKT